MKRIVCLLLILGFGLVYAQEGMQPPAALDNAFIKSYVGEWKGKSTNAMGESEDWMKCYLALQGQFMFIEYKAASPQMTYEGGGAVTLDPMSGDVKGYWVDSMRDMSQGKGKIEGNKLTMEWTSSMGTGTRIEELMGNKLKVTSKWKMPDGSVMESTSEFTKVEMSTK